MSSCYSDDNDYKSSVASSSNPVNVLKAELPETLPKILDHLRIENEDLRVLNDRREYHIVYVYTDTADSSQWVVRVAKQEFDDEGEEDEGLSMTDRQPYIVTWNGLVRASGLPPKSKRLTLSITVRLGDRT